MKALIYKSKKTLQLLLFHSGYYFSLRKKLTDKLLEEIEWKKRIYDVLICEDNKDIPRVSNAGQIIGDKQVLHNGLQIKSGSYYGSHVTEMLRLNKGVHEPQEEKVFTSVLKHIPENAVMIELGAYWSFYSMWFYSKVKKATCYMIEPDVVSYYFGKLNFRLNKMKGHFTNAFVSSTSSTDSKGARTICVDDFVKEKNIKHINILHSDIQGYEYEMLKGARQCFDKKMISYIFISTHSDQVHNECLSFLANYNFKVIAAADLSQTYSVDGLIAARAPFIEQPDHVTISLKPA